MDSNRKQHTFSYIFSKNLFLSPLDRTLFSGFPELIWSLTCSWTAALIQINKRFLLCHFFVISRNRMKARAPSPPQAPQPAPRNILRTPVPEGGNPGTDAKENLLRPRVHLLVTLPQGYQTSLTEDGRWGEAHEYRSTHFFLWLLNWHASEWEPFVLFGSVWVAILEGPSQRGPHLRLRRLCP